MQHLQNMYPPVGGAYPPSQPGVPAYPQYPSQTNGSSQNPQMSVPKTHVQNAPANPYSTQQQQYPQQPGYAQHQQQAFPQQNVQAQAPSAYPPNPSYQTQGSNPALGSTTPQSMYTHTHTPGGAGAGGPFPSAVRQSFYPPAEAYGGACTNSSADLASEEQLQDLHQFNAQNHFVRFSVGRLPNSSSLRHKSHIPLGLTVQPLAPTPPGRADVPAVSFGSGVVVRCKRCRTYINPFIVWEGNGRRWVCNLCGFVNDTPQFYCRALDSNGKREDRFEREELCMGSVEFIAPADYMIRPPQAPAYLFLIDVSLPAVASGLVDAACAGILNTLKSGNLPGDTRTMVGVITYDSSVHFYGLKAKTRTPQVYVVSQIEDIFLPLCDDLFVNFHESRETVENTIQSIPNIWRTNGFSDNCMGTALKAAVMVIKSVGGKIVLFSSGPPTVGEMSIKREPCKDKSKQTTDRETELLKPANDTAQQFAQVLTQSQITVDLFLCPTAAPVSSSDGAYYPPPPAHAQGGHGGPPQGAQARATANGGQNTTPSIAGVSFYDLSTYAPLAQVTSGEIRLYPSFSRHQHQQKLHAEIDRTLTRNTGWEAVMRIRVSRGWKISGRFGRFFLRGTDLFVLPTVNEDQMFSIVIEPDDTQTQTSTQTQSGPLDTLVMLQAALLYTNSQGERRIRVHTFCVPLSQNLNEIAMSIDPEVTANIILQQAMDLALRSKVSDGRAHMQNSVIQMVTALSNLSNAAATHAHAYGAAPQTPSGCSEQLKQIAYYIMGLLKSVAFRGTMEVSCDVRAFEWLRLQSVPLSQVVAYACPRMFSLCEFGTTEGTLDGNEQVVLPATTPLSSQCMRQEGAFLVENGESMIIWIGKSVSLEWLNSVFGVSSLEFLHPEGAVACIGQTNSNMGARTVGIIHELQRQRRKPDAMQLILVRQGDANEQQFFAMLVEDRVQSLPLTFAEFLQKVGQRQMNVPAVAPGPRAY